MFDEGARDAEIRGYVWKIKNTRDGYVAWCDDLKLTAEGETYDECMATMHEILDDVEADQ